MREFSVGIADRHPLMAQALTQVLATRGGYRVMRASTNHQELFASLESHCPDALILDPDLLEGGLSGIEVLSTAFPECRIVVFTSCEEPERAVDAMKAGARSYVLRTSAADELVGGLEAALAGEVYFTPRFAARVIGAFRSKSERKVNSDLSVREEQIVKMLLLGKSNRDIAGSLNLSEKTIKSYMTILMQKLRARSRLEVVMVVQQRAHEMQGKVRAERPDEWRSFTV